jgi:hypothetical protein
MLEFSPRKALLPVKIILSIFMVSIKPSCFFLAYSLFHFETVFP